MSNLTPLLDALTLMYGRTMPTNLTFLQQFALWAQIGFYIVTGISVAATGMLAAVKFRSFSRPFINVSLEASSRPCSQDYVQIGVAAKLYNGSQNLAKVEKLEWECRGIAIYPPEAIEEKKAEYFHNAAGNSRTECGNSEFPWNVQQRIIKKGLTIAIEPNETSGPTALKRWVKLIGAARYPAFAGKLDKLNCPSLQRFRTTSHDSVTFVVPGYCTAVQIRLFIPTKRKNDMGWTAVIYHDTPPIP